MKMMNREEFLKKSVNTLSDIVDILEKLPLLNIGDLPAGNTALVIIDMINGFARQGALKSPRVELLIPEIVNISKACDRLGISKLAFADCHTENSPEFDAYPVHCMSGTFEGEIVDEIKETGGYKLISKNSTNGFLEEEFQAWLGENPQTDTFIVTGDCTDICIQQFAITLKTWFNKHNKKSRIIVPINAVDTYDMGVHNGDLMDIMALFNMMGNGIEIVRAVEAES